MEPLYVDAGGSVWRTVHDRPTRSSSNRLTSPEEPVLPLATHGPSPHCSTGNSIQIQILRGNCCLPLHSLCQYHCHVCVPQFDLLFAFPLTCPCFLSLWIFMLLLKAGNSCYYSVQTLLSSKLRSKNFKIEIYKTIILPVILLYGCQTWSLTLREESRLRVFENRILRRIFGELHSLYRSPNIVRVIKSRRLRWAGHVARMGRKVGMLPKF